MIHENLLEVSCNGILDLELNLDLNFYPPFTRHVILGKLLCISGSQ